WQNVLHYRRVVPRSVRKAKLVIVPTRAVAAQLIEALGTSEEKIRVIPCGVDYRFKPASEARKRELRDALGLRGKFVLFVGNLEPKKNLVSLVQAFFAAKANRQLPHKLVLAGRLAWKHKPILRMIAQLGLQDEVILPGRVPQEYLPALYSAADMFVFPSLIEGFGLPPLEAMACGTPAIVSKDPALLETTGGAAMDVDATDLAALREAIEAVATREDLRAQLIEKGKARAAQFSWVESARATLQVYHEAVRMARNEIRHGDLLQ
ncbi:MAG TPA: glycosyltransferase family 1 protein, partial [Planctomycetota bacterium]|nr:glycosyltransferase family 1 protein [Planctomycetota bacterium]